MDLANLLGIRIVTASGLPGQPSITQLSPAMFTNALGAPRTTNNAAKLGTGWTGNPLTGMVNNEWPQNGGFWKGLT